jgi:hypothetical protein
MQRFMLRTNEYLRTNEFLVSPDNRYFLIMQGDGNFVEYVGTGPADNRGYVWDSASGADGGEFFAVMQGDGNLVIYKGTGPHDNRGYVWDSNTPREPDDYFAILQGDGNFVVYKGKGPEDNRGYVWDSGVIPSQTGATGFIPSIHGWPFGNSFPYQPSLIGLDIPISFTFGFCGGMSAAALDRYLNGVHIPRDIAKPKQGEPLYDELLDRQRKSLMKSGGFRWAEIYDWQRRPDQGHWWQPHSVGYLTKKEWPKLGDKINTGLPTILCLIRVEGYTANPTNNHQVLAYKYDYNDLSKDLTIWVYEPNWPNHNDVRLTMNFGLPKSNINARQSTGERLRGFFVM